MIVASSGMLIWKPPSPTITQISSSGRAKLAPMAVGTPKPIAPSPPEVRKPFLRSWRKYCAVHIWCWPTSVTIVTFSLPAWRWISLRTNGTCRVCILLPQDVARLGFLLPLSDLREPCLAAAMLDQRQELRQHLLDIARDADIGQHVLVDLGRVDVHMDHVGVLGVGAQVAGDAIVEAHAQGDQQVGVLDGLVDPGLAVHAHHAQVQRMRFGDAADAEERRGDRDVALLGQLAQLVVRAAEDDAVAGQDDGALGIR